MRAKRQPAKQSGGSRLARAFGASKRGAKRGANWLVDDLKMKKALPSQNMEKVVLSLQKVADGDLFIQNGVVDKLSGGRVKLETNRDKQIIDRGPKFLGVPGVEVQVKKPTMKMTRTMKMGAGYKKLEKSADGDCGCSD